MKPEIVFAGKIRREYILPSSSLPVLDMPGGSLLYSAGGARVWGVEAGLLGRVNHDFPQEWIEELNDHGLDTRGIRRLDQSSELDQRYFIAYTEKNERSHVNAVSHFARLQMRFPRALLGYQPLDEAVRDPYQLEDDSPSVLDTPQEYRDVQYVHLCPFDFTSQSQLINIYRSGPGQIVSIDPAPSYMNPGIWRDLRLVLQGVSVFIPSEDEMRLLFWGETNDLWEMAMRIADYGPKVIVIKCGGRGQLVYDVKARRKYEIPAYPSRVADPTGAGDAFCGGFLAGYRLTSDSLEAALCGNISASLNMEGSGPFYSSSVIPGLAQARLDSLRQLVREV